MTGEPIHSDPYTRITWLRERLEAAEADRDEWESSARAWEASAKERIERAEAAEAENARLREEMGWISEQQQRTLAWLRDNGVVFDGPLGRDPKNWQHVAFSIYTDLCEVDSRARAALAGSDD